MCLHRWLFVSVMLRQILVISWTEILQVVLNILFALISTIHEFSQIIIFTCLLYILIC